jgi:hypothetical protein
MRACEVKTKKNGTKHKNILIGNCQKNASDESNAFWHSNYLELFLDLQTDIKSEGTIHEAQKILDQRSFWLS